VLKDAFEEVVVIDDVRKPVVAYATVWNGKRYFHIRTLYQEGEEWKPGKGLSVPYDQRDALLVALGEIPLSQAASA
jgi:Transcriptional Coactivator p15 (PC4)